MKGSLIVVGFFALGCLLGWSGWLPDVVIENDITVYVLYLLMFQVGLSIGSDKKLKDILGSIRPKLLLVPLATIAGTLVFSALVGLLLTQWSVFDCLAVGSGFAYYSLSSILITAPLNRQKERKPETTAASEPEYESVSDNFRQNPITPCSDGVSFAWLAT